MNKVIAYILNYDKDDNARRIHAALPCTSFVIDSSGKQKDGFIATDTPFAAGCMNKAITHFRTTDATHILLICSDVIGDWTTLIQRIEQLDSDIGVYTPSVAGQGWGHQKPRGLSTRNIPFAEGMIACYRRRVIENIEYLEQKDAHCYGIDIYLSWMAKQMCLKCIADDSIMMYHPFGSGYNQREGERQMRGLIKKLGDEFKEFCQSFGLCLPFYKRFMQKHLTK